MRALGVLREHKDSEIVFGRAPTDYETCRCCELITYVGDPICDEGSSFLNALAAAGANEVYSYIRTPDDPHGVSAWSDDACGTLSGNVTNTDGCAVCGSSTLAAFSRDQCDAIQPQLDYGGDRTNIECRAAKGQGRHPFTRVYPSRVRVKGAQSGEGCG